MPESNPAPAPTPEPAPGADPSPSPAPAPAPAPSGFLDQVQDTEVRTWAENKGWKDAGSALKSAMNLEKMIGAPAEEVVRIPANADESTLRNVYSRLGMPEAPDGYEITLEDGDENIHGPIKELFHKVGLTKSQAAALQTGIDEIGNSLSQQETEHYHTDVAAQDKELQREFGNAYGKYMNVAKQAAEQLGFSAEILDSIESAVGYKDTMKFMVNLGRYLGESRFAGNDSGGGQGGDFGMSSSPEDAKRAWASMQSNAEEMTALRDKQHPNHKAVMEKKSRLFSLMYPEA